MAGYQIPDAPSAGYICKQCGVPTPLGIGYVSYTPGAREASESSTHEHPMRGATATPRPDGR